MNAKKLLALPAILSMAVGSLLADPKPTFVVQEVSTKNADAYVAMIAKINALVKTRTGIERLRHVWEGDFAGGESHHIFVVTQYASAAEVYQVEDKLKGNPELDLILEQLKGMRELGASALYKSIRFDGIYEGGAVYNTDVVCSDEDGYVKALDDLKVIFDANGFKDARINLWRIAAGRSTETHIVIISLPSKMRVAELLDTIYDKALLKDWTVGAAKLRTVSRNGTYHEITK